MNFNTPILDDLPDDPVLFSRQLFRDFKDFDDSLPTAERTSHYNEYLTALSLLKALSEVLGYKLLPPELSDDVSLNIGRIIRSFAESKSFFDTAYTDYTAEQFKKTLQNRYGSNYLYQFTDGDLERVQKLIDELRGLILSSELLYENHKQRLLKRLEKLQSELHKKMSNLDRFWALSGEAAVMIGKFGNDVKPIVDVVYKIIMIVWRTQAIAEGLPTDTILPRITEQHKNIGSNS